MKLYFSVVLLCVLCLELGTASRLQVEKKLLAKLQQLLHLMEQKPGLTLHESETNKLEGTFIAEDNKGIFFLSESDGLSKGKLLVTTLEGKMVFHFLESVEQLMLISVADETLLYSSPEGGEAEIYKVAPSHLLLAQNAVQESDDFQLGLLKDSLEQVSEEEGMACLNRLLEMTEEIELIIKAVNAMVDKGLTGAENNAARLFFTQAIHLEAKLAKTSPGALQVSIQTTSRHDNPFLATSQTVACNTFDTTCPSRSLCPGSSECFGMCGRGCTCWQFLCGDCCRHRGCEEHDTCCRSSGFSAGVRCWFPIGFSCEGPFMCE